VCGISENVNENIVGDELTVKQVFDVLEFAKAWYSGDPYIANSAIKSINMNPLAPTKDSVDEALANPKEKEALLRSYSEYFEYVNSIYKRLIYYVGNMLSFDISSITCVNAIRDDYNTDEYKKDLSVVEEFLWRFDYKGEFKKVVRQLVRQDAYFGAFRDDGDYFIFQELPADYCKITGRTEYNSFLFDFNMAWFNNAGVDINDYPKAFNKYKGKVGKKSKVSNDGVFIQWVQTSPEDKLWAWKFDQEHAGQIPLFAPMFPELIQAPLIRQLQTNEYMVQAAKVIFGEVPFIKDKKSAQVRDQFALSDAQLGKFLSLAIKTLPKGLHLNAAPLDNVQAFEFSGSNGIAESYNKNTVASSGVNSRLIFSNDRMTAEEVRNSIAVDSYMMTYLYPMFNRFMEYQINKRTGKFKFAFKFHGTEFDSNKKDRMNNAIKYAEMGIFLPDQIASGLDMNRFELQRQLEESSAMNWTDKFTMISSMYQTSNKDGQRGRPTADSDGGSLSDSAIATRDAASNIDKGGNI